MTCVFDVLDVFPGTVLESVQRHGLPVNSESLSVLNVSKSWDLEWEQCKGAAHAQVLLLVHLLRLTSILIILDREVVIQELSVKSTHDHDLIGSDLAHSCSLSRSNRGRHLCLLKVNFLPLLVVQVVNVELEALNGAGVLFVGILDSAEHVDEFMIEVAT